MLCKVNYIFWVECCNIVLHQQQMGSKIELLCQVELLQHWLTCHCSYGHEISTHEIKCGAENSGAVKLLGNLGTLKYLTQVPISKVGSMQEYASYQNSGPRLDFQSHAKTFNVSNCDLQNMLKIVFGGILQLLQISGYLDPTRFCPLLHVC